MIRNVYSCMVGPLRRLPAAAALLLLCIACEGAPSGPGRVYDPCVPTVLALAPDTTESERASTIAAIELWRQAGGPSLSLDLDVDADAQVLPLGFEPAARVFFGIYRPDRGDILINRGLSARAQEITIAHEIGHAFGLSHVTNHLSLMNPGNLNVPPGIEEARLISKSGACQSPEK